jgi:hypothetical protein
VTATHATVRELCKRTEGAGHKLYIDNLFSSPDLFDELTAMPWDRKTNSKVPTQDLRNRRLGMKKGDVLFRVRGDMTILVWKDKRDIRMLNNIHVPQAEANIYDAHKNTTKPEIVADYNIHMGYVDNAERMTQLFHQSSDL